MAWRAAFVAGLLTTGGVAMHLLGQRTPSPADAVTLIGAGCTSGHGGCGLGRLSKRSLAAVMTFMATAVVTVYIAHMVGGSPR